MSDTQPNQEEMSTEERIGFHKGSLSTLAKERAELARILNIVEQLIQMHSQELKGLGVNLEDEEEMPIQRKDKKPIEDLL